MKGVRHHPGAGAQLLEQSRPELQVEVLEEVQGDDACRAKIGLEQVLPAKAHAVLHPAPAGIGGGFLHPHRVDVHSHHARAEAPRRLDALQVVRLGVRVRTPAGAEGHHRPPGPLYRTTKSPPGGGLFGHC